MIKKLRKISNAIKRNRIRKMINERIYFSFLSTKTN